MENAPIKISAAANVALIKYWGKLDLEKNIPAAASLSIGIEHLRTDTKISKSRGDTDTLVGKFKKSEEQRILNYVSMAKKLLGVSGGLEIETENNFPASSGLASSASGFAAIALGIDKFYGLDMPREDISRLARLGSGSAARSIYGGFVQMDTGPDPSAKPLVVDDPWPLDILVLVTEEQPKKMSSTDSMNLTKDTSPFYSAWLDTQEADFLKAKDAIEEKDFWKLAQISEHNCLKMHSTIMTSKPPHVYWNPTTVEILHQVQKIQKEGLRVFFTIDAGPQVKLICDPSDTQRILEKFESMSGISRRIVTKVGGEPKIEQLG
jgi:diphosphomevalonate decarboxylase